MMYELIQTALLVLCTYQLGWYRGRLRGFRDHKALAGGEALDA